MTMIFIDKVRGWIYTSETQAIAIKGFTIVDYATIVDMILETEEDVELFDVNYLLESGIAKNAREARAIYGQNLGKAIIKYLTQCDQIILQ